MAAKLPVIVDYMGLYYVRLSYILRINTMHGGNLYEPANVKGRQRVLNTARMNVQVTITIRVG